MYKLAYGNTTNEDLGMIITSLVIPPPYRRVNTTQIAGRDGDMYEITDEYEDIDIKVALTTLNKSDDYIEWHRWWDKVKRWLRPGNEKLEIGTYPGKFFKVKNIRLSDPERTWYISSSINATITCDPYIYLDRGEIEQPLKSGTIYADCGCNPVYKFVGETIMTLSVNGQSVNVNIGQNITLDTDLMTCYRETGETHIIANADVEGVPLDKLRLKDGKNIITIKSQGNVMASIIPHWRYL